MMRKIEAIKEILQHNIALLWFEADGNTLQSNTIR